MNEDRVNSNFIWDRNEQRKQMIHTAINSNLKVVTIIENSHKYSLNTFTYCLDLAIFICHLNLMYVHI